VDPQRVSHPEPCLRLRPSPRKWLVVLAIATAFAAVGATMVWDGDAGGWAVTVFFAACAGVALLVLLPASTYLEIRHDGFEFSHLLHRRRLEWGEVGPFSAVRLGGHPMVVFNRLAGAPPRLGRLNAAIVGANDALPDTYGKEPGELAALMNAARERALGVRGGGRAESS